MKAASFVHKSISEARMVLENVGFCHVQIKDFDIPRAKIFRYFNNLYGLVELVLRDEIEKCYSYIDFMALNSPTNKKPLVILHYYRSQFIKRSKLLRNFQRDKENLPAKFRNLRKEIEEIDKLRRIDFLSYYETKKGQYSQYSKPTFLSSLMLEFYVLKEGESFKQTCTFLF